ncbi:hypothetical protein N0V90_005440 [Kalmusia sp. IMI 367209]|nr:hypothetical protein N0V90_005440 [Kalmusia sp. IMI 367209]
MRTLPLFGVAGLAACARATPYERRCLSVTATPPATLSAPISSNGPTTAICTGCVIEAYDLLLYAFNEEDYSTWTSLVVTQTILTKAISYFTGTPAVLQTVVTEVKTLEQTTTVKGAMNELITHTTPVFTIEPTPGVELEVPAGTYFLYQSIYGGLDHILSVPTEPVYITEPAYVTWNLLERRWTEPTCTAAVQWLPDVMPTRTKDWLHFIHSVTGTIPNIDGITPEPLPPALINYLNQEPRAKSIFRGSNLATCTLVTQPQPSRTVGETAAPITNIPGISSMPSEPSEPTERPPDPFESTTMTSDTSTYIRTTYQSTSTHITVQGCLRCDTPYQRPPVPTRKPDTLYPGKDHPAQSTKPGQSNNEQSGPGQSVLVGDDLLPVHPAKPVKPGDANGPGQNVVIGSKTLTPGQTTTINNVPVAVPIAGGGSIIVVGTNTHQILPTGPPILSVGDATLAANSQGQFIIGSETLSPGGTAIIVNGYTLSLGSDGNIAVVNGVTQTLANAQYHTRVPVLTVGGQEITATVVDGTTEFIIGPGQTLLPGTSLIISGKTYSMPSDASGLVLVIDGVTSTLGLGILTAAPDITIAGSTYSATVRDGTTEYVMGPGTTLRPGDTVTISGITYSLDGLGTALVIDGHTSTFSKVPASNSATPTRSASSTQAPGEFVESEASVSSKGSGVSSRGGMDKWIEGLLIGLAGYIMTII